ncbi:MAG: hypothetical protein DDT19_01381 [Syntrophomonadaceae bacterium]|nr:hypothetical protein [Bacillota bacterium]
MIKNCIIFKYSDKFKDNWNIVKNKFSQSTLKRSLEEAQGFAKPRINALAGLARNEKIRLKEERPSLYVATFSCEFRTPKLIAAGVSPPFVPVSFRIWLRKRTSWVISFDAGRKLSGAAITLLSYATTGNPSSIEGIRLEKGDFLKLKDWLLADGHSIPGQIKRITMHDIEEEPIKFKQIVLNSSRLEISTLFNHLLNSASAIANLTFSTPPLKSGSRSLTCKINYWGCITIYTPDLLDSEVSELIEIFEDLFGK